MFKKEKKMLFPLYIRILIRQIILLDKKELNLGCILLNEILFTTKSKTFFT